MKLSGWKKYSIPHIMMVHRINNRSRGFTQFYGLSFLCNNHHLPGAILYTSWLLTFITCALYANLLMLLIQPIYWLLLSAFVASIDTYCKIKNKRRIKIINTLTWVFDKDNHKKHRPWHLK